MPTAKKKKFETVDEYVKTFPQNVQTILQNVRRTIRKAAPAAEEAISYQIPAVKLNGKWLMAFAGWKSHISIYSIPEGSEAFKKELAPYIAGRGTVRFPIAEPIPYNLLDKIVKFHLKGLEEGQSRYRSSS